MKSSSIVQWFAEKELTPNTVQQTEIECDRCKKEILNSIDVSITIINLMF
jgi:hypothetical protein